MKYNTKQKQLPLPEYGRAIQRMVDHAVTIEDREERQRCAQAIIDVMGNMFPQLRDSPNFKHKFWDHLAIMSDFKLDIDYPYEVIKPEMFKQQPTPLKYTQSNIRYRHYGRCLQKLIDTASTMEEDEKKQQLVRLIAMQMKKNYILWNKDNVEDKKIFEDMQELSKGRIVINENDMKLELAAPPATQRNFIPRKKAQNNKRKF